MNRTHWLDLFTGTTWEEFKEHGANVSGFRYHSNFAFYIRLSVLGTPYGEANLTILIFNFPLAPAIPACPQGELLRTHKPGSILKIREIREIPVNPRLKIREIRGSGHSLG